MTGQRHRHWFVFKNLVMAGLVPAIHVDPRDKPGDDGSFAEAKPQ